MALIDAAVLKPGTAHFYTAPEGTGFPTDLRAPGAEWVHMGHTSMEDILSADAEGGEQKALGSLQKAQLRTSIAPITESFSVNLLQLDVDSLKFYFGSNVTVTENGRLLNVPSQPVPVKRAWLCVIYDGEVDAGYYTAKAEFLRGSNISVSDVESLVQLPIKVTPLGANGSTAPYGIIPPHKTGTTPTVTPVI